MQAYRIIVYVPDTHLEEVKNAVFNAGGGVIGNYDRCCWQSRGIGQFRPEKGAHPYIGHRGEDEKVDEWKVEFVCVESCIQKVIEALKKAHPYETPAFQYWKVNTD